MTNLTTGIIIQVHTSVWPLTYIDAILAVHADIAVLARFYSECRQTCAKLLGPTDHMAVADPLVWGARP